MHVFQKADSGPEWNASEEHAVKQVRTTVESDKTDEPPHTVGHGLNLATIVLPGNLCCRGYEPGDTLQRVPTPVVCEGIECPPGGSGPIQERAVDVAPKHSPERSFRNQMIGLLLVTVPLQWQAQVAGCESQRL